MTEYFRFSLPERPYEWCYSARKLEKMLNDLLVGDKLEIIYVSGADYADPFKIKENFVNYFGSRVYLEFEKAHVDIQAHASGLFEIRTFEDYEVKKTRFLDEAEDIFYKMEDREEVLCDTGYIFLLNYTGETVQQVIVKADHCLSRPIGSFDKRKMSKPVELPGSLIFFLGNKTRLTIAGWDADFIIQMEQIES